ncbi:MAG: DUF3048 domain-containing protein, partial [Patescibacteria group bacterium]|nr:DUF3048 domain-containing protein [Patescibacteria group bacterium]
KEEIRLNLKIVEEENKNLNSKKQVLPEKIEEKKDIISENELACARKKMRIWMFAGAGCFLTAFVLAIAVFLSVSGETKSKEEIKLAPEVSENVEKTANNKNKAIRMIDGAYVEEEFKNVYPIAVMIDNHPNARPAYGLEKAQLVIEAEAEGGTTRYMAFFAGNENVEKIGPVRSARPYFVDWSKELSALYAHVGGSPEALAKMAQEKILHINEFYNGTYFWRDTARDAPHNVYSSLANLWKYLEKKELSEAEYSVWKYRDESAAAKTMADKYGESLTEAATMSAAAEIMDDKEDITINFLLSEFKVDWEYISEQNNYLRYLGGKKQIVSGNREIFAKNVIIQYVDSKVLDEEMRQEFQHIGNGYALVCMDGVCEKGFWRKKNLNSRTKFYNLEDNQFEFNRGTTWIEVVNPGYEVEY